MLKFPKRLQLRVVGKRSGEAVPKVALKFTLFAERKNNYTIPLVTNGSGEVYLSVDYVRQSIRADWELFPMDYVSRLEESSPEAEIKVCSSEDVERTIEAMKTFKSASTISDGLIEGFQNSVNAHYLPTSGRFNVEKNASIEVGIIPSRF
jgi:hypothetical protein